MYKLVIFDLDGTLLDTIGDLMAAGNHTLRAMGMPQHTEEDYKRFVGNGIPKLIERMLPEPHNADDESRALELFSDYYGKHKSDRTKPYEGMPQLIERLSSAGIVCVCNTNKAQEFSAELVRKAYGENIRDLIGAGAGFPAKPAPDAALELCRRFGTDRADALYVGDSNVDMNTAAAAGIASCGVLWGFRSREELESCNPMYIAENIGRLHGIIVGNAEPYLN